MEEVWLPPKGELMLGVHRDVRGGQAFNFEFLRIEVRSGRLTYVSIPNGKGATEFPLKLLKKDQVVFENLHHDFPRRIIYWKPESDRLCARVEGPQQGKTIGEEWCWKRQK